jgi:mercuric reductase
MTRIATPSKCGCHPRIAIIGSGAAGFAAAIRAAEAGAAVTMIERADRIGGTCVNVGCVPSKALLRAAALRFEAARHPYPGIARAALAVDRPALVAQIRDRVDAMRAAKYERVAESYADIALIRGEARFESDDRLRIDGPDGPVRIGFDRALIATGAEPLIPSIPGLAETPYWTSTEALFTETAPRDLIVIGSSYVALELAQAWHRLGCRVTVLARGPLLGRHDPDLGAGLKAAFEAEGIAIRTDHPVRSVSHDGARFAIATESGPHHADALLVAAGRRPATAGLGLAGIGVETDDTGAIRVDAVLRTSNPRIFAAGDCAALPQLVYVAAAAGTRAAIAMLGGEAPLDLSAMPSVIFTDPAVAMVGMDERTAREAGIEAVARRLDLDRIPRALVDFDTTGFVKLVAEAGSNRLIGAQILARNAGEAITAAALAIKAGMSTDELGDTMVPHLVLTEGLKLAAQAFRRDVATLSCCAG